MGDRSTIPPSFKHVPALDGIRGVAILLVLGFHLLWSNVVTGSRFFDAAAQLRSAGWIGVDLFFALSGYLITGILLDTRDRPHYFRNFYARRALRIFPLYYAVLLLLTIAFHPTSPLALRPFLTLAAFLQNTPLWWHGHVNGLVANFTSHLWSLAVEEQFYLVWPLVVLFVRSRRALLWLAFSLAVCSPALRWLLLSHGDPLQATYKLTVCRADGLLAGAWLATAVRGRLRETALRLAPVTLVLGIIACLWIAFTTGNFDFERNRAVNVFAYSALALTGTSLIALTLSSGSTAARVLQWRPLRFFGQYSYGLYVLHQIIAAAIEYRFGAALRSSFSVHKALFHITFLVIVLSLSIPLAMLSYHFFERPFLRLKRFFDAVPPSEKSDIFPQRSVAGSPRSGALGHNERHGDHTGIYPRSPAR